MITIIVHVEVKLGFVQDFINATIKSKNATSKELGCLNYDIMQDVASENKFILSETYSSESAIESHKLTPHFLEWRETVQDMMACPRVSSKNTYVVPAVDEYLKQLKIEAAKNRYDENELAEFNELILEKLNDAEKDLIHLEKELDSLSDNLKNDDEISEEEIKNLKQRQEKYIINLKNALIRIENKTYGICRVTGQLISKERLRNVPHATINITS